MALVAKEQFGKEILYNHAMKVDLRLNYKINAINCEFFGRMPVNHKWYKAFLENQLVVTEVLVSNLSSNSLPSGNAFLPRRWLIRKLNHLISLWRWTFPRMCETPLARRRYIWDFTSISSISDRLQLCRFESISSKLQSASDHFAESDDRR